jgi:hypothetical protein
MLGRVRELAPAAWVPAIWTVVTAALAGAVAERTLLVAHAVMSVLLVAFVALSWRDMDSGALRAWRLVILAGTPLALAGLAGLANAAGGASLRGMALVGWQLLPGPALVFTGRRVDRNPAVYRVGGYASVAGAAVTLWALSTGAGTGVAVGGIALAVLGQTAGIVAAVVDS